MSKADRCVVRNQAYRREGMSIRERHNERKNESYANADIDPARSPLNVHYKRCEGTYTEAFDRLEQSGVISTRGLKQDAKVMDELVFDVNTAYFERGGGYEYAKAFFEEAYRLAVKEAGGEQYILSAVMHADERNKALSEELGRDVYHYHLHVVYVPVVEKEIKWSKRCKDPTLVGTTKEVIHQVSHSKKWASEKALDENGSAIRNGNGRAVLINAYSLLQDRFYEHMRAAGYEDLERGQRGSTAAHLSVLDYKVKQEAGRLEGLEMAVEGKAQQAARLDSSVKQTGQKLTRLQSQLAETEQSYALFQQVERSGKRNLLGKMELQPGDWNTLLSLAKAGALAPVTVAELKRKLKQAVKDSGIYQTRWEELRERTKGYLEAERLHPEETRAALEAVKTMEQAAPPPQHQQQKKKQHSR